MVRTLVEYPEHLPDESESSLPELETPYGSNTSKGKFVFSNGIKMYYEIYGKGFPLFLIHGNSSSSVDMKYQAEAFKENFQVILVDSRAHGKSERGTEPLSYKLMAKDYIALAKHLQIKQAHFFGWSDGANIALQVAILQPVLAKSIVAFAAVLSPDSIIKLFQEMTVLEYEAAKQEWQKDTSDEEKLTRKMQLALMCFFPIRKQMLKELKKVTNPVLVMAGEFDIVKLQETRKIAHLLRNSELYIVPKGTHFAPYFKFQIVNQKAKSYLQQYSTRSQKNNITKSL
ncbi:MAG: alpha/beta hydrolase [Spirochaetota bacterium]